MVQEPKDNRELTLEEEETVLRFINLMVKLEAVEVIGIARILQVPILTITGDPKQFEDLFSDLLDKFITINRKSARQLLKAMQDSISQSRKLAKAEAKKNGINP